MFPHEQLQVYNKALQFTSKVVGWSGTWDRKHAVVDQMSRAAESIVVNLVEAARLRAQPARLLRTDYAIGSSLECAGCLDIARVKALLTTEECEQEKRRLCEITKMLVGLRKAWGEGVIREESPFPINKELKNAPKPLFHHERLEVYRLALSFIEWFTDQPGGKELSSKVLRRLDEAGTSVVLNIAEGNGRYAELDQHRFLEIAQGSAVKAAVYLDLSMQRELLEPSAVASGKEIVRRIGAMLAGF